LKANLARQELGREHPAQEELGNQRGTHPDQKNEKPSPITSSESNPLGGRGKGLRLISPVSTPPSRGKNGRRETTYGEKLLSGSCKVVQLMKRSA